MIDRGRGVGYNKDIKRALLTDSSPLQVRLRSSPVPWEGDGYFFFMALIVIISEMTPTISKPISAMAEQRAKSSMYSTIASPPLETEEERRTPPLQDRFSQTIPGGDQPSVIGATPCT